MDSIRVMDGAALPVEYVKRKRQKNIRIRIKMDRIVVSAPHHCSKLRMQSFLKSQHDWVNTTHRKLQQKRDEAMAVNHFDRGRLLLRGEWVPLLPDHSFKGRTLRESGDTLIYPGHLDYGSEGFRNAVIKFYRDTALTEIPARLTEVASGHGFTYKRVFIRSQKTKWGTCSTKGNLSFNWRLIKCPPEIWHYLFVHELSHLVHFNHSPQFWQEVARHYPGWKQAEKWLKQNNYLLFMDP